MTREAEEPTLAASLTRAPASAGARIPSSGFVPGTIVAGRYRLVALLGRGGMGEVYRADDLTLDQPVALKFLPAGVALDDARLAQFHNELRTARQIAHKNVCRLYDLGEFEGRRFLTMEYVDGEDLASLLRRIGRLPQDKAVQIARQLCAGISAAHERGVVHRDLKPANVMLDGDGNVRVTDFGLAASAGDEAAVWAGTPQYMAPEQLTGKPATIQSDIYALGLVLYEIFTGRRAHQAQTLDDLRRAHDSGPVSTPSSHVRDIDPAIERVIMRCLERDPAARPTSVLGVAAALPGANPLADALAAGETPSPELIAAAGKTKALPAAIGLGLLAFTIVGLFVLGAVNSRTLLVTRIPFEHSMDVLEDRAEQAIRALGYVDEPADSAGGLLNNNEAIGWIARTDQGAARWERLASGSFPTLRFWYRTSPQPLEAQEPSPRFGDPPFTTPRMLSAVFDTTGRLTSLAVIPPPRDGAAMRSSLDWSRLFDAAGLKVEQFHSVPATRTPTVFADERAAWEGPLHEHDDITVHVEAAAHEGLPVFFTMSGPWTSQPAPAAAATPSWAARMVSGFSGVLVIAVWIFGGLLAYRHYRTGRADLRTATRAFLAIVVIWLAIWVFERRHVADLGRESAHFFTVLPNYLMNAGVFWLLYVGLEPFARRYTPEMLFSWTRLMRGEVRDPRVGRDILVGLVVAMTLGLVWALMPYLAGMVGQPPPAQRGVQPQFLLSASNAIARTLRFAPQALQNAMLFSFVFVIARALIGRLWPAAITVFAVSTVLTMAESGFEPVAFTLGTLFAAGLITVLIRVGVFALATAWFTFFVLTQGPITTDFGATYGAISAWLMLIVSAIAVYAFYASRGGAPLFGQLLKE